MTIGDALYAIANETMHFPCWEHAPRFKEHASVVDCACDHFPTFKPRSAKECGIIVANRADSMRFKLRWADPLVTKRKTLGVYHDAEEEDVQAAMEYFNVVDVRTFTDPNDIDQFREFVSCQYKLVTHSTSWFGAWLNPSIECNVWTYENKVVDNRMLIGAFYQCYKQPRAFEIACDSYRNCYPNTTFVIVSDNGNDYAHIARRHNAFYWTNKKQSGNGKTTNIQGIDRALDFMRNFTRAARLMKEEYFVLHEDDVHFTRCVAIENPKHDIISNTPNWFPERIERRVNVNRYGGAGGSLFKTSFWADIEDDELLVQDIQEFANLTNNEFHLDIMLSFLCLIRDGTMMFCIDHLPHEINDTRIVLKQGEHVPAIYHLYKRYYT